MFVEGCLTLDVPLARITALDLACTAAEGESHSAPGAIAFTHSNDNAVAVLCGFASRDEHRRIVAREQAHARWIGVVAPSPLQSADADAGIERHQRPFEMLFAAVRIRVRPHRSAEERQTQMHAAVF